MTDLTLAVSMVWFEIALVIFVVVFLVIVAWVLLSKPTAFRDASRIPLDDDVVTTRETDRNEIDEPVGTPQ